MSFLSDPRKILKISSATVFGLAIFAFAIFQSRNLLTGPTITIESPTNGNSFPRPLITLVGTVKNAARLSVNDHQSFVDEEGRLIEDILLNEGYNVITIKATDRFGREKIKRLEFIYQPAVSISPPN